MRPRCGLDLLLAEGLRINLEKENVGRSHRPDGNVGIVGYLRPQVYDSREFRA
jgi:hypothetical protein